jgi:hypothetical protein
MGSTEFTGKMVVPVMRWRLTMVIVWVFSACAPPQPTERIVLGEVLLEEDFSNPWTWERYYDPNQHVDFRIEGGAYRAQAYDGGFIWALNAQMHSDVVIQVDTQQISADRNSAYGVMCRAALANNGDGYYFMIGGDGSYTLRRGSLDRINALIEWTYSDAIQQGRSINRIRAACIGDYLALYVNGQFVAETYDSYFNRGYAGLTAAVPEGGEVDVTFDDLTITAAALAQP